MIGLAVGVVVAMNPPDFRQTKDGFQFLFEWPLGLQVAKKYNRCRAMHAHGMNHEREISMYVTAKEYSLTHSLHPYSVTGSSTTAKPPPTSFNSNTNVGLKSKFSIPR
jgi:hypothetical protein